MNAFIDSTARALLLERQPNLSPLDRMGPGTAAGVERSGMHGRDSRIGSEQYGGGVGEEEGVCCRHKEWETGRGMVRYQGGGDENSKGTTHRAPVWRLSERGV